MKKNKYIRIGLLVILFSLYALFLAQPIRLITSDLGRHLKNGELILNGSQEIKKAILTTNFYSYTNPDFPFINHHWLTGVIFYIIKSFGGFPLLQIFSIALSILTFYIFFHLAEKYSNFYIALLSSCLAFPLIAFRSEIRPEVFSYLFCAIFFSYLIRYREKDITPRWLFILPLLEILWVNLHIYFFLGLVMVGIFLIDSLINRKQFKFLFLILCLTIGAALINPANIAGFLHPFTIYGNHGFKISEEQSLFRIESIFYFTAGIYFKLLLGLLFVSWIVIFWQKRLSFKISDLLLSVMFGAFGLLMIRNFAISGLFALSLLSFNLKQVKFPKINFPRILLPFVIMAGLTGFILLSPYYWIDRKNPGIGLKKEDDVSAKFFLDHQMRGPIFNNYDIGGYLIYYLFPKERPFVDNRPETYPVSFFQKIYIPMQEGSKWDEFDRIYNFQSIFYFTNDLSAWRIQFIRLRSLDPKWAIVYIDNNVIIFAKRNGLNQKIIDNFEIPAEKLILL